MIMEKLNRRLVVSLENSRTDFLMELKSYNTYRCAYSALRTFVCAAAKNCFGKYAVVLCQLVKNPMLFSS